jgi:hypothetical protein
LLIALASSPLLLAQEFRDVTYIASVLSGQLKSSSGISVKAIGSEPFIVGTGALTDSESLNLGQVWQLMENQELTFRSTLPKGAIGCQIQLLACGMSKDGSTLATKLNNEKYQDKPIKSLRETKEMLECDIDLEALLVDQDNDTPITLSISSRGGLVGIQSVKITFRLPVTQIAFGKDNSAWFSLSEPSSTVYAAKGEPLTIRWTVSNAPASSFVNLAYKRKDGRIFPIVTAHPIDQCEDGAVVAGSYQWHIQDSATGSVEIIADPFVVTVPKNEGEIYSTESEIICFAVSNDFRTAIVVESSNTARATILDVPNAKVRHLIDVAKLTKDDVVRFAITNDGRYSIATRLTPTTPSGANPYMCLYDNNTGKLAAELILPRDFPGLALYGNMLLSENNSEAVFSVGNFDPVVKPGIISLNYDRATFRTISSDYKYAGVHILPLGFSGSGNHLLVTTYMGGTTSIPNTLSMLDFQTGKLLWKSETGGALVSAALTPDGLHLVDATPTEDPVKNYRYLRAVDGTLVKEIALLSSDGKAQEIKPYWLGQLLVSPDGKYLLEHTLNGRYWDESAESVGAIQLRDIATGKVIKQMSYQTPHPNNLPVRPAFSPDSRYLLLVKTANVINRSKSIVIESTTDTSVSP